MSIDTVEAVVGGKRIGSLRWMSKSELSIPTNLYQREPKLIAKIVQEFNWPTFGTLIIGYSITEDCKYNVIDGGHRLTAVMTREDIDKVPVMVYSLTLDEQAAVYKAINKDRIPLKSMDIFKVDMSMGDEATWAIKNFAESIGRRPSNTSSSKTFAQSAQSKHFLKYDLEGEAWKKVMPLVARLCVGKNITKSIMTAFVAAEVSLIKVGHSLSEEFWSQKVLRVGYKEIADNIAFYEGNARGGNPSAANEGLRKAIGGTWEYYPTRMK